MYSLYVEKKPQVSSLSILLGFPQSFVKDNEKSTVNIDVNSINLRDDKSTITFHIKDAQMLPMSCRGLQINEHQEVQMTLNCSQQQEVMPENHRHLQTYLNQTKLVAKLKKCDDRLFCRNCGQRILRPQSYFSRVLPLPTENWSDYADMWFCHQHDHGAQGTEDKTCKSASTPTLTPKTNDCLVGTTYLLIQSKHIKSCAVKRQSGELVCKRCRSCIGIVQDRKKNKDQKIYKLYLYAILLQETEDFSTFMTTQGSEDRLHYYITQLLKEESRLYTSFRFIVSATDYLNKTCIILVWLLDENVEIYHSLCKTTGASQKIDVQPVLHVKLLYRCLVSLSDAKPEDKAIYKLWERDNTVHGISLPYSLSLQVISSLIDSSRRLPESVRYLNGFNVGLLRTKK